MRNLIEHTVGDTADDYNRLTSMLHIKQDTESLTDADLFCIYRKLFNPAFNLSTGGTQKVLDLVFLTADKCLQESSGTGLQNKVVLSIASRLRAEQYIIARINDPAFVNGISKNQTARLLSRFREEFSRERPTISLLDKVALMTPENVHLNSFMYEPILDMSDDHLRSVYQEISHLHASFNPP